MTPQKRYHLAGVTKIYKYSCRLVGSHFVLILIILFRLAEDVVFAVLKVCVKESSDMILQCGTIDDEAFQSLVTKHPVSQP